MNKANLSMDVAPCYLLELEWWVQKHVSVCVCVCVCVDAEARIAGSSELLDTGAEK